MREITSIRLKWSEILLLNMLLKLDQSIKNQTGSVFLSFSKIIHISNNRYLQIYSIKIILRF